MFSEIVIENLRVFEQACFRPGPGINLVTGANGAGKTSLLEAVHLVATGRSFRHRDTQPLIREGAEAVQLVGRFSDRGGHSHVLGLRREKQDLVVRLDGRGNVRRSEILELLPVQFIGADPQDLISGPPEKRRAFLDNGLFHVEHDYLAVAQHYARALAQRNAALRSGGYRKQEWDAQLASFGERLDAYRARYVPGLVDTVRAVLHDWGFDADLAFSYRRGWSQKETLGEALARMLDTDRKQHFTSVGPHRADLVITARAARSGKILSRGQLKMLVAAMYLAQARLQSETRPVQVLLFDDIGAELDADNRARLLRTIGSSYPQVIVTSLDPPGDFDADSTSLRMFHVEHGTLHRQDTPPE